MSAGSVNYMSVGLNGLRNWKSIYTPYVLILYLDLHFVFQFHVILVFYSVLTKLDSVTFLYSMTHPRYLEMDCGASLLNTINRFIFIKMT